MWKLLTGVLAEKIYVHLEEKELFPEEKEDADEIHGEQRINY